MVARKAIVALINGCIHIDPVDVPRVDMEKIQAEAVKALGKPVEVVIAPINEWMPASGTKALMDEAMKKFLPPTLPNPKNVINSLQPSRNARRVEKKKQRYGKRYF